MEQKKRWKFFCKLHHITAHHKQSAKMNENQSVISKKYNSIFQKKSHHGLLWFWWVILQRQYQKSLTWGSENHRVISSIQISHLVELNYAKCIKEIKNSNFFQREVVFQTRFSPGVLSRGEGGSVGVLRQGALYQDPWMDDLLKN